MTTQTASVMISGNTYPHRQALAAMGGRWNPTEKAWAIPTARAEEARRLVGGAAKNSNHRGATTGARRPVWHDVGTGMHSM